MGWLILILLILMGLLGIAGWLKSKNPQAAGPLAQLESIEGWVGLVGLVFGLYLVLRVILNIGAFSSAPLSLIMALVTAFTLAALGLLLGLTVLKQFLSGSASHKAGLLAAQLSPYKMILGFVCLGLAVWSLLSMF